jgi:hypothetical protein
MRGTKKEVAAHGQALAPLPQDLSSLLMRMLIPLICTFMVFEFDI